MVAEQSKKLTDFLASLEHLQPTVHDELTRYQLRTRGWRCTESKEDTQLLRLVSLAAQKFVADVSHNSLQIQQQKRRQTQARLKEQGLKDQKPTLNIEDMGEALQEYGINMKPAPYFLDGPSK